MFATGSVDIPLGFYWGGISTTQCPCWSTTTSPGVTELRAAAWTSRKHVYDDSLTNAKNDVSNTRTPSAGRPLRVEWVTVAVVSAAMSLLFHPDRYHIVAVPIIAHALSRSTVQSHVVLARFVNKRSHTTATAASPCLNRSSRTISLRGPPLFGHQVPATASIVQYHSTVLLAPSILRVCASSPRVLTAPAANTELRMKEAPDTRFLGALYLSSECNQRPLCW